ncbi:hypothetical protein KI387_031384 [Taxus chinensis]|uniref:Uncharacterized protein n=1 Tax=Taxus chinensis TaxID=29808 RepID=A0AA38CGD3_TAXCH|nr:hypothetical protein KI387_031384 [Taxus chinensis]
MVEAPSLFYSFGDKTPIILASILTILCLCAFTLMLLLDIKKAFKKRANWLPGNAFLLTVLTIQALYFVTGPNIKLSVDLPHDALQHYVQSEDYDEDDAVLDYVAEVIIAGAGILNIIVFLGYFLPAMLAPRSISNLAVTAALAISIFFPVKNLFNKDKKPAGFFSKKHNVEVDPALFSEQIPLLCIIFLIFLLGCTGLAGKTVRRIMTQRISAIFAAEDFGALTKESHQSWDGFQNELFKSWIVARASQPQYVLTRSVLSSAAGLVVSGCFIYYVVQYIYIFRLLKESDISVSLSPTSLPLFLLLGLVLVGWIVICCRWFLAVLHFPWHRKHFSWRRCFGIEDFWTRSLVDMIHKYDVKDWQSERLTCFSLRLHKLLHLFRLLPILVVLISKICWLLSEMVLGMPTRSCLKFIGWCRLHGVRPTPGPTSGRYVYEDYSKTIEPICMPGEDPLDLWKANKNDINRIAILFNKGHKNGSDYTKTHSIFTQFSTEWVDQGSALLDKFRKASLPQVVRYFPSLDKQCWKMTAVSFIAIIMEVHTVKSAGVTNAVKACNQVWDFLRFADSIDFHPQDKESMDCFDTDTDEVSMAADREFFRLRKLYENLPLAAQESYQDITIDSPRKSSKALVELLEREKELTEKMEGNGNMNGDIKDCMKIAPRYNLYKLYKILMDAEVDIEKAEDLVGWAEMSLRNVIACFLSKMPDMLSKQCRKCAQGFDEDNIWEAVYLAGKARGMMEPWGLQLQLQLEFNSSSAMEWKVQHQLLPGRAVYESDTTPLLG